MTFLPLEEIEIIHKLVETFLSLLSTNLENIQVIENILLKKLLVFSFFKTMQLYPLLTS